MMLEVDARVARGDFEVDAAFGSGEAGTVALLGPNGAGKSTLVEMLAGLRRPLSGTVSLGGSLLDGPGVHVPSRRRSIGVVFQEGALFPNLSVLENVAFGLRARGVAKARARDRARAALGSVGVDAFADRRPGELSGGQARAVALARALVLEPDLLLLDEPTASLDVASRAQVHALLRASLPEAPGVRLLVTHDPSEAMSLAERAAILEEGRISQAGTWDELRDRPATSWVAQLVGLNRFEGRLKRGPDGDGIIVLASGAEVACGPGAAAPGSIVAVVGPSDVVLHAREPEGSARNLFRGRVLSVRTDASGARVRLDTDPALVAQVTSDSVRRLGIAEGTHLWASFKAVEVRVLD
jgi:molybdate transport system ATP-binding protein